MRIYFILFYFIFFQNLSVNAQIKPEDKLILGEKYFSKIRYDNLDTMNHYSFLAKEYLENTEKVEEWYSSLLFVKDDSNFFPRKEPIQD